MHFAQVEEKHVGRGVDHAQRAVERKRVGAEAGLETLREHQLIDVAGADVALGLPHRCQKIRLANIGTDFGGRRLPGPSSARLRRGLAQRRCHRVQALDGAIVVVAQARTSLQEHVGDQQNLVPHVVEHQQVREEQQVRVRQPQVVAGAVRQPLQQPGDVVGKITDRAGGERRQPRPGNRAVGAGEPAELVEQITAAALAPPFR